MTTFNITILRLHDKSLLDISESVKRVTLPSVSFKAKKTAEGLVSGQAIWQPIIIEFFKQTDDIRHFINDQVKLQENNVNNINPRFTAIISVFETGNSITPVEKWEMTDSLISNTGLRELTKDDLFDFGHSESSWIEVAYETAIQLV